MGSARHIAANALTFLIIGLVVLIGLISWGERQFRGTGPLLEPAVFELPKGAGLASISDGLRDAGVISNATIFRIAARYSERDEKLKFGVYEFAVGVSMQDVLNQIVEGSAQGSRYRVTFQLGVESVAAKFRDLLAPSSDAELTEAEEAQKIVDAVETGASIDFRVTIPEGMTSWEVVQGLNRISFLKEEITDIPAEGSLAPDTYSFKNGDLRQRILDDMTARQVQIVAAAWAGRAADLPITTPEEMLVLASIVEKEAGGAGEWGMVSSVFINRLNRGMRLEADATIVYGITLGRARRGFDIRQSEIHRRTPYNTYQIDGLPPTPIGNPGSAAIEATVHPETTEFIFFVADGTGGHAFATNLADHNANVRAWEAIQAKRP